LCAERTVIGKMDDDSLYVVLKVYGHLQRNERERPEEKSSGRFFHTVVDRHILSS